MENIKAFESFGNDREVVLTSERGQDIKIVVQGGKIKEISNDTNFPFPFKEGQAYHRNIETWACRNRFKIDGKNPCPEEKIFGIRKKDIPQGHELRMLFPGKFR